MYTHDIVGAIRARNATSSMKQSLNVTIIHCGFIYSGGGERIVLEEAKGLKKRGHRVIVRAPTLDPNNCYPQMVRELEVRTLLPQLPEKIQSRYAIQMVASSILAPLLSSQYKETDVFVGANQPGAWIAMSMAQVLNKPYVVYMNQPNRLLYPREVDQENGWVNEKSYALLAKGIWSLRSIIKKIDHPSFQKAHERLVNGSYIGGVIESIYHVDTKSCPAGAHPKKMAELLEKNALYNGWIKVNNKTIRRPYILLTNRHDPQKKFEYAIQAMSKVTKEFSNVQLVIPGPETPHTKKLLHLRRKLRLQKNILFLGKVAEKDLQKLYKNAAVYVYPSPQEDFGMGPLEAGAWAVPTVAWNNAGPTVTVKDGLTGFLAKPFEIDDYAEKIISLLQNPTKRNQMGDAAWQRVSSSFSWEKHIDILEETLRKSYDKQQGRKKR